MNYFDKNIKVVTKRFPELAQLLKTVNVESVYNYELILAKNSQPIVRVQMNDKQIYLHSSYDPQKEAKVSVEGKSLIDCDLVFVFGLGLGYQLKEIVSLAKGKNVHIFIIEKDVQIVKLLMQNIDLAEVLEYPSVNFCVGLTDKEIYANVYPKLRADLAKNVHFIDHQPSIKLYKNYYNDVLKIVHDIVSTQVCNIATVIKFKGEWLHNVLINLPIIRMSPGVCTLQNKFTGLPAILVAAGPSLDKNITHLPKAKGKAVIIAVGTSLKSLYKENIKPDIVITGDSSMKNYEHFKGLNYDDLPLAYDNIVQPQILKDHAGIKFSFDTQQTRLNTFFQDIESKGTIQTGGSVANTAFSLAVQMGCNPIILIGQDLAFTGGRTHTKGSIYGQDRMQIDNPLFYLEVPGYYGDEITTSRTFYTFLKWFENYIDILKDRLVINATEGGAKIPGTLQLPLNEAIEKHCSKSVEVSCLISETFRNFHPTDASIIVGELNKLIKSLKQLSMDSKQASEKYDELVRMFKRRIFNRSRVRKIMKKVDDLDDSIKSNESSTLLTEMIQDVILASERGELVRERKSDDDFTLAEKRASSLRRYYGTINEASNQQVAWFEDTLKVMGEGNNFKGEGEVADCK